MKTPTATVRINVLMNPHNDCESPRIRVLIAMIAVSIAKTPLISHTVKVNNPRLRHPNTSTGVNAIVNNTKGAAP